MLCRCGSLTVKCFSKYNFNTKAVVSLGFGAKVRPATVLEALVHAQDDYPAGARQVAVIERPC